MKQSPLSLTFPSPRHKKSYIALYETAFDTADMKQYTSLRDKQVRYVTCIRIYMS